jgi:hypothetical protein
MNLSSAVVKRAPEIVPQKPQQALCRVADCLYRSNTSGIIYGILTHAGRQIRRRLKRRNKDIARARLARLRDERLEASGHHCDAELAALSFKAAATCWLESVTATQRSRTPESRRWSIKALLAELRKHPQQRGAGNLIELLAASVVGPDFKFA